VVQFFLTWCVEEISMARVNGAQLHLLLNHLPVILPLVGIPVLVAGIILRSVQIEAVGLWILVASGLAAIPTYLTGSPAEKVVKNYPGVSRLLIDEHEASALKALILIELSAVASLFLLIITHLKWPTRMVWRTGVVLLTLIAFVLVARAAHLGGLIRHEEIQGFAASL
jgi:uncharacterized membrane protein